MFWPVSLIGHPESSVVLSLMIQLSLATHFSLKTCVRGHVRIILEFYVPKPLFDYAARRSGALQVYSDAWYEGVCAFHPLRNAAAVTGI